MKFETVFNIGDIVFYIHESKVKSNPINAVRIEMRPQSDKQTQIRYRVEGGDSENTKGVWMLEERCFASKSELLDNL